jgi:hypothetical protein
MARSNNSAALARLAASEGRERQSVDSLPDWPTSPI